MKKAILSLGFIICAMIGGAYAQNGAESTVPSPNPNAPKFKFETEDIDYGTIENGSDGVREFKFTNVGKEPLIITHAQGSCGCTVPVWPKEPIMPGKSAVIKVTYDTKRGGSFQKQVTITSNAETPSKVIKIHGVVKEAPVEKAPVEGTGGATN